MANPSSRSRPSPACPFNGSSRLLPARIQSARRLAPGCRGPGSGRRRPGRSSGSYSPGQTAGTTATTRSRPTVTMRRVDLRLESIPEPPRPQITLFGCRPVVPYRPGRRGSLEDSYPTFRAPIPRPPRKRQPEADPDAPPPDYRFPATADCPACKGRIGRRPDRGDLVNPQWLDPDDPDWITYCELCGAMAPRHDATASQARVAWAGRSRAEQAMHEAILCLREHARKGLTDSDLRRIALGYPRYFGEDWRELHNLAWIGRRWIREEFRAGRQATVSTAAAEAAEKDA